MFAVEMEVGIMYFSVASGQFRSFDFSCSILLLSLWLWCSACFLSTTIFTWYKCLHALAQTVYYRQTVAHSEDGRMSASMYWVLMGWATLWCMA